MIVIRIFLKLVVFIVLLLSFMSLYQHGPGGFLTGLRGEIEWVKNIGSSPAQESQ